MSTKIAPRGEEKLLALRKVLVRIENAADKARGFADRKLGVRKAKQYAKLAADLWNGREPCFLELMGVFHGAMEDFRGLVKENYEARLLAYRIPSIKRWDSNTQHVRWALEMTSQAASEWLAAHPAEKNSFLIIKTVEFLLDRTPRSVLATLVITIGYIHYAWWVFRGRKRVESDD
ncbi:MAG: hypothetical protein Q7S08_01155 [bacterium]|nr:hypothetical protein [bacterium]